MENKSKVSRTAQGNNPTGAFKKWTTVLSNMTKAMGGTVSGIVSFIDLGHNYEH